MVPPTNQPGLRVSRDMKAPKEPRRRSTSPTFLSGFSISSLYNLQRSWPESQEQPRRSRIPESTPTNWERKGRSLMGIRALYLVRKRSLLTLRAVQCGAKFTRKLDHRRAHLARNANACRTIVEILVNLVFYMIITTVYGSKWDF